MLRIARKTEYALLALHYLGERQGDNLELLEDSEPLTVKAIAAHYHMPALVLAKVMQQLKKAELVDSVQGSAGGYRLLLPLSRIPLLSVLNFFDEPTNLVVCQDKPHSCSLIGCDIKQPLARLTALLMEPLKQMSVRDLFDESALRHWPQKGKTSPDSLSLNLASP